MSGEFFLFNSKSLWTVMGFPRPQQFQLKMTKGGEEDRDENPDFHHAGWLLLKLQMCSLIVVAEWERHEGNRALLQSPGLVT